MYEELERLKIPFCVIRRNGEVIKYSNLDDPEIIRNVVRLYNTSHFIHESLKDAPETMSIVFNGKRILVFARGDIIQFAIAPGPQEAGIVSKAFGGN
jgi:hypothetical protein